MIVLLIFSVYEDFIFFSEPDKLFVKIKNRVGIFKVVLNIDFFIIRIYIEPRLAGCEACILRLGPLDGRSGILTAYVLCELQKSLFAVAELLENTPVVEGHNVLAVRKLIKKDIRHADFLTLINKRCSAKKEVHRRKHFTAFDTVIYIAVTLDNSRMVVIFDIKAVPALAIQTVLPF